MNRDVGTGIAAWLKQVAVEEGASLAGLADPREPVADLHLRALEAWTRQGRHGPMGWWPRGDEARRDPRLLLPGARSLLMVAVAYDGSCPLPDPPLPRVARYALGRDYHKVLRGLLRRVVQRLEARQGPCSWRICVDSTPLLERYWAWRAGLGWIGRNSLLLHPRYGSWLMLGGLLLDLELDSDLPHPDRCGRCRACLDSCPVEAFPAPYVVDSVRCLSAQTIENRAERLPEGLDPLPGSWLFGCDACQDGCPWCRKAGRIRGPLDPDPELLRRLAEDDWPEDDDGWDAVTRGKALRRMTPAMYRRNLRALPRANR